MEFFEQKQFLHVFLHNSKKWVKTHAKHNILTNFNMIRKYKYISRKHKKMLKYSAKSRKTLNCVTFVARKIGSKAFTNIKISDRKRYFCTFSAFSIQNVSNPMHTAVIWTKRKITTLANFFQIYDKKWSFLGRYTAIASFSPYGQKMCQNTCKT